MRLLLARMIRAPRTLCILLYDWLWVPWLLKLNGVQVGLRCRFVGRPVIQLAPGARISLGDDVRINSRFDSNAAGIAHPTILAAMEEGSSIEIGNGSGISGASIVARERVRIGERVLVGAGACIWDTDFHPLDPLSRREHQTRGARRAPITIEDEAFIGGRAIVLKGVRIGRGAVVGAAALVIKDVAAGDIVAGNPAQVVGSIYKRGGKLVATRLVENHAAWGNRS
ncbi:MAG: acyltransferase [Pyrinomonadaceae bacterium]